MTNNQARLKELNPYIHFYLHVRSGCVCIDEKVTIPIVLQQGLKDDIHASHPGTWGIKSLSTHCWLSYVNKELILRATECKPCSTFGKNLKSVIYAKQFHLHIPCAEPNKERQNDLLGPISDEKGQEIYFLAGIDRFSKFPTACLFEKANGPNLLKFLDIENHGIPRSISLDPARSFVGHQVKTFCNTNNIEIIEAPVKDHWAIGLLEKLIHTIKNRLACIKEENPAIDSFNIKHAKRLLFTNCKYVNENNKDFPLLSTLW